MARYKESQGQIYDSVTGRWMGVYDRKTLRDLNGGVAVSDDLESNTVPQLRALAKDLEVEGFSAMDKAGLVKAVGKAQKAAAKEAESGDDTT